ncbi:hypothetical protein ND748_03455 [Frankia sp. AiPs1]|uniref:hypothetical protein n=1 Tax=Frankia sp. AiPs1 TaxID=573493 RepID=UPI0020446407|nr:hypothetical protein [Frankia sp. AiPs1]MCM3920733.1 hypothetical protein [Frankia sp. AiPs1]
MPEDDDGQGDELAEQRARLGLAAPTPAAALRHAQAREWLNTHWGPRSSPWRPPQPVPRSAAAAGGEPAGPRRITNLPAVPGRMGNLNIRARGHVSDDADDYGPDAVQRTHWEIVANDRRLQNRRRWTARNNPAA